MHTFEPFVMRSENRAFVVFRHYSCVTFADDSAEFGTSLRSKTGSGVGSFQETIILTSKELKSALNKVSTYPNGPVPSIPYEYPRIPKLYVDEISAPYLFLFHHREALKAQGDLQGGITQEHVDALLGYLDMEYGHVYDDFVSLLKDGKTKPEYLELLFRPNDTLVKEEDGVQSAYVLRGPPIGTLQLQLFCWSWKMDGVRLIRDYKTLDVTRPTKEIFDIRNLETFPARFLTESERDKLLERGRKCWGFRNRYHVAYEGWSATKDERYVGYAASTSFVNYL